MVATSYGYKKAAQRIANGEISLAGGHTFKAQLVSASYVPAQDSDQNLSDINEAYRVGTAATLENLTEITTVSLSDIFDFDDLQWESSNLTARYLVVYDDTHASDALLFFIDFGENKTASGGNFDIVFSANGVFGIVVDPWDV